MINSWVFKDDGSKTDAKTTADIECVRSWLEVHSCHVEYMHRVHCWHITYTHIHTYTRTHIYIQSKPKGSLYFLLGGAVQKMPKYSSHFSLPGGPKKCYYFFRPKRKVRMQGFTLRPY